MNNADLLSKRLSVGGAQAVGTRLRTHAEELTKQKKIKLPPKVLTAADSVYTHTEALGNAIGSESTMNEVDRGADRCISAFHGQIEEIIRGLDHEQVLPLEADEVTHKEAALRLQGALFPAGTGFLKQPFSKQWAVMKALVATTQKPECATDLKALGLDLQAARVGRWFELYGQKLGLTSTSHQPDRLVQALDAWHRAWGTLVVQVRAAFDEDTEEHQLVRDRLLAPYEEQADAERREEQRSRKNKKPEPTEES